MILPRITGYEGADIVSYFPEMAPKIIPVDRDEAYIRLLDEALKEFNHKLGLKRARLIELGHIIPKEQNT